jgi:microcystin-dependent protein
MEGVMSEPFIGQIMQVGFNFAPRGWAMCNGQSQSIQQNSALFALLGTTFGGNGTSTFNLPNLQGRTMVGVGQLPGGSNYVQGQAAGTESTTLTQQQMPTHTHATTATLNATNDAGTDRAPAAGMFLSRAKDVNPTGTAQVAIYTPTSTAPVALAGLSVNVAAAGGSVPVSILSPYLAMTTIIALQGIFPSRN